MKLNDWDLLKLVGIYLVAHLIANTIGNNFDLFFYRKDIIESQAIQINYLNTEKDIMRQELERCVVKRNELDKLITKDTVWFKFRNTVWKDTTIYDTLLRYTVKEKIVNKTIYR